MPAFHNQLSALVFRASVVTLGFALVAGCFNPDLSGTIKCNPAESGNCPDGQVCSYSRHVCASPEVDGGSASDLLTPPPSSGCRNGGGTELGVAWGCLGIFGTGEAALLCADTFVPCADSKGVDLTACNTKAAFFAADAMGKTPGFRQCSNLDAVNFQCGAPTPGYTIRLRFGCGNENKPYVLSDCTDQCGEFDRAINCSASGSDYLCLNSDALSDDSNMLASMGLLCCPR